jgi:hypothetical protein
MLRGSWTHGCARATVGVAVAFALVAALALEAAAADAPVGRPAGASPSTASPAVAPASAEPAPADAPAGAPPPSLPPPAAPSPTPSSPATTELDGPAPRTTAGTGGSTQSGLAGCAVWTDRCVICQRDSGVIACSNIGIACQPQPMVCLRPDAAPEKKPEQ